MKPIHMPTQTNAKNYKGGRTEFSVWDCALLPSNVLRFDSASSWGRLLEPKGNHPLEGGPLFFETHLGDPLFHLLKPPGKITKNMASSEVDSLSHQKEKMKKLIPANGSP